MNTIHAKNNRRKNGEYNPSYSRQIAREKAESIEPTQKQKQYRDALYEFCLQKGLVWDGFKICRTKQGMHSNIQALISILEKNGLADEFFGGNGKEGGNGRFDTEV